jgi:hypothetical protein
VRGTLRGGSASAPALKVQLATIDGRDFPVDAAVEVADTDVKLPGGSIRRAAPRAGDGATRAEINLSGIELAEVDWRAGPLRLVAERPVTLGTLEASVVIEPEGVRVTQLDVRDLAAQDLHVTTASLDVHVGGRTPLRAGRIHVQDLFFPDGGGAPTGKGVVTGLHADIAGKLAAGLQAKAAVKAGEITVELLRDGRVAARATSVSGWIAAEPAAIGLAQFADADTGRITFGPDGITIKGLRLPYVSLESLDIASDQLVLHSTPLGTVYVMGLTADARIDREFKQVEITKLEIDHVDLEGVEIVLPGQNLRFVVPKQEGAPMASIRHLRLEPAKGARAFVLRPGAADLVAGIVRMDAVVVPRLESELAGSLRGAAALRCDAASIELLERGGVVVDLANPRMTPSGPVTLYPSWDEIRVEDAGAARLRYADGTLTVRDARARGLRYSTTGVDVRVERLDAAGDAWISKLGGNLAAMTVGQIPELALADASVHVDFTKLAPATSAGPSRFDVGSLAPLLEHLEGELGMDMRLLMSVSAAGDYDVRAPVLLRLRGGAIDDISARWPAGSGSLPPLDWTAARPGFSLSGSTLTFKVEPMGGMPIPIASWRLTDDQLLLARPSQQLRIGGAGNASASSGYVTFRTVEFSKLYANLAARSPKAIPLHIDTASASGDLMFAPDALIGLRVSGGITIPVAGSTPRPGGLRAVSLQEANLQSAWVRLDNLHASTGAIEIRGLRDATLTFDGVTPLVLDARITSGTARDIFWDWFKPSPR